MTSTEPTLWDAAEAALVPAVGGPGGEVAPLAERAAVPMRRRKAALTGVLPALLRPPAPTALHREFNRRTPGVSGGWLWKLGSER